MDEEPEADTDLSIKEIDEEDNTHQFILELENETQRIMETPKQKFCKYVFDCSVRDADCLHPYKTEGCHTYKELEKL